MLADAHQGGSTEPAALLRLMAAAAEIINPLDESPLLGHNDFISAVLLTCPSHVHHRRGMTDLCALTMVQFNRLPGCIPPS
jgi:hypothetical protein